MTGKSTILSVGRFLIVAFRSEAVKKWDWLRVDMRLFQAISIVARCLSQFFHSLSAKETMNATFAERKATLISGTKPRRNRVLFLLVAFALLHMANAARSQESLIEPARKFVLNQSTGRQNWLGLAEVYRAAGQRDQASDALRQAAKQAAGTDELPHVYETICWRSMPVQPAQLQDLQNMSNALVRHDAEHAWATIFRLYAVVVDDDSSAEDILGSASQISLPASFPNRAAERAHRKLLTDLGLSESVAGLRVIQARDYKPLYALRDLDRRLTREADNGSEAIRETRDRLRQAYVKSADHVIERLFAWNLNPAAYTAERMQLLKLIEQVPYVNDTGQLDSQLQRLGEAVAWNEIIRPLLESEIGFIDRQSSVPQDDEGAVLIVNAEHKQRESAGVAYKGAVKVSLGGISIRCDQLVELDGGEASQFTLRGQGHVQISGVRGFELGITANEFVFQPVTGRFQLTGDVRLSSPIGTQKYRFCTLRLSGVVSESRTLLDDFADEKELAKRLLLLDEIVAAYEDDELPPDVAYLLALKLLRPHLTWHSAYAPPPEPHKRVRIQHDLERVSTYQGRWSGAHGGEPWMGDDIPQATHDALQKSYESALTSIAGIKADREDEKPTIDQLLASDQSKFFWRLKAPQHADVLRAIRLLKAVVADANKKPRNATSANRWLDAIERNNTVLTFDILGGYSPEHASYPVLVDVCNADRISFKLYRVRTADDLIRTSARIGEDFIYRDYGLQNEKRIESLSRAHEEIRRSSFDSYLRQRLAPPSFDREDLVHAWSVDVGRLKSQADPLDRQSWDDDWERWMEGDGEYFEDSCYQFQDRLDKSYSPGFRYLSSWRCNRIVEIPKEALGKPGAFVLIAEANGQQAFMPILFDPLSLTMRRCRDGVFVMVSDPLGSDPIAGATIHADQMLGKAKTDMLGVAFAKVRAMGDRAIIAQHKDRFAIGGFGAVFSGIYESEADRESRGKLRVRMIAHRRMLSDQQAHAYANRYVMAAYTDRPTYRPGQKVGLKLIVRRLPEAKETDEVKPETEFRSGDFQWADTLELPTEQDTFSRFEILNPSGRVVRSGSLKLGDFGTGAAEFDLSSESMVGNYSLRIHLDGMDHVVPDVFAVKYYRRPNFEVQVDGVPKEITIQRGKPTVAELKLHVSGRYYFGKPVVGQFEVRLVRKDEWQSLARASATLGSDQPTAITLELPQLMSPGEFQVVCSLTDASGRTVDQVVGCRVVTEDGDSGGNPLDQLPGFAEVGAVIDIKTTAREVLDEFTRTGDEVVRTKFAARNGTISLKLDGAGWHRVSLGERSKYLFVYGGEALPDRFPPFDEVQKAVGNGDLDAPHVTRWVDLTDYDYEEDGDRRNQRDWKLHLRALFEHRQVEVGGTLRVLVYAPVKRGRLLFTTEGRTIVDYHVTRVGGMGGKYHVIDIPIKERHQPNFYLQGRVIAAPADVTLHRAREEQIARKLQEELSRDDSEDPRWCKIDVSNPRGAPGGPKLDVRVETDAEQYRPGDEVTARITVTDLAGKPREAEVSLAAVDESVFVFGEDNLDSLSALFSDARPPRRFLRKAWRVSVGRQIVSPELEVLQMREMMKQEAQHLASFVKEQSSALQVSEFAAQRPSVVRLSSLPGMLPVASVPLARIRRDFRETAVWQPLLRTGADGVAETKFKLPDSLARFRLSSVGLTRETEIGVGRARLTAALPFSVQLMLPRFAVEKDRLQAVAVIHNHTDELQTCTAAWEIKGASVRVAEEDAALWNVARKVDGTTVLNGQVDAVLNKPTLIKLWLDIDKLDDVAVTVRVSDGKRGDAESRTMPVQPLGRAQEFSVKGKFTRQHALQLPAGFVARDLRITLTQTSLAKGLDGLEYLIDYPYGCVEQTMSRFLPLVMAKRAVQQTSITLPPEALEKMPKAIARGLERLYNFQHANGSWGWFREEEADDRMTVYVLYGLVRCKNAGTAVDEKVLNRGLSLLAKRLRNGQLAEAHRPDAIWVLALAGRAEVDLLREEVKRRLKRSFIQHGDAQLALACKAAGLFEEGEQLAARLRNWNASISAGTDELALKLNVLVVFGAELQTCRSVAHELLELRSGYRWRSTQETSAAIEALSQLMRYDTDPPLAERVAVSVGGQSVFATVKRDDLKKAVYRIHLDRHQLSTDEALPIKLEVGSDEPASFTITATGVQRLDRIQPTGDAVKVLRRITTVDGKPIDRALKVGEVVAVHLDVELTRPKSYMIVEDRRPAGCEFADELLSGAKPSHVEFRDDRVSAFFTHLDAGRHELVYYLRAETRGTSHVLPGIAYPMYDERTRGETGALRLEID